MVAGCIQTACVGRCHNSQCIANVQYQVLQKYPPHHTIHQDPERCRSSFITPTVNPQTHPAQRLCPAQRLTRRPDTMSCTSIARRALLQRQAHCDRAAPGVQHTTVPSPLHKHHTVRTLSTAPPALVIVPLQALSNQPTHLCPAKRRTSRPASMSYILIAPPSVATAASALPLCCTYTKVAGHTAPNPTTQHP